MENIIECKRLECEEINLTDVDGNSIASIACNKDGVSLSFKEDKIIQFNFGTDLISFKLSAPHIGNTEISVTLSDDIIKASLIAGEKGLPFAEVNMNFQDRASHFVLFGPDGKETKSFRI